MRAYVVALALTLAVELPLYWAVLARYAAALGAAPAAASAALTTGLLANVASHPLAFLAVYPALHHWLTRPVALTIVEAGVLVVEAVVVYRRHRDPFVAAVTVAVANVGSLAIGVFLL